MNINQAPGNPIDNKTTPLDNKNILDLDLITAQVSP